MAPVIIDNETKLRTLLNHITKCRQERKDQLMFVDLEGVKLGRSGQVAIMQILMPSNPVVYLVDVHILGPTAFDFTTADGTNLRSILESRDIIKVIFDVRNDSDALYAHFQINLDGVIDLQVIEYATRNPRGAFVHGLAKCIERDLPYQPGWSVSKAKGLRLFAPELGGRYEVFLERPIVADIIEYCEQDVILMPQLLAFYGRKLDQRMAAQLPRIIEERINLSKTPTYNGHGRHKAFGPQLNQFRSGANLSITHEMDIILSDQLSQLCRLNDVGVDGLTNEIDATLVEEEQPMISDTTTTTAAAAASNVNNNAITNINSPEPPANISNS